MPSGRMQIQHVETLLTVGTLGANNAIQTAVLAAGDQGKSLRNVYTRLNFEGKTAGEGPVWIGYSVGLTNAELAACLDAIPTRYKDPAQTEQANRRAVTIWDANRVATASINAVNEHELKRIRIPKWDIPKELALNLFAFSNDNITSGMTIRLVHDITYDWLHD